MPAVSKKQQRFFGIIRAIKKGVFKGEKTPEIQRVASSISDKDSKKMASTKHKGLPEKKKEKIDEILTHTAIMAPTLIRTVPKIYKGVKTAYKVAKMTTKVAPYAAAAGGAALATNEAMDSKKK